MLWLRFQSTFTDITLQYHHDHFLIENCQEKADPHLAEKDFLSDYKKPAPKLLFYSQECTLGTLW